MPRVASSAVDRIHYTPANRTLDIWYSGGGHYQYRDVPNDLYEQLMAAPSVGAFVNRHIKPHFAFTDRNERRRFRPDT